MQLETRSIPCPMCGATQLKRHFWINGYQLGPCKQCNLWQVNPQPTQVSLTAFYQQDYYRNREWLQKVEFETVMQMSKGKLHSFEEAVQGIQDQTDGRQLLDVGCAFGQFLQVAKRAGYSTSGIELDPLVAKRARDFGMNVLGGDFLASDAFSPGSFDAVTFWYVLEHVIDPVEYVRKAYQLLKPGGVLFIRVPNMTFGLPFLYASLLKWPRLPSIISHIPAHLFFFTARTLRGVVEQSGFRVAKIHHGEPTFSSAPGMVSSASNLARQVAVGIANAGDWASRGKFFIGPYLSLYAKK